MLQHEPQHTDCHELLRCFAEFGVALNGTLEDMLNEHFSHHTERRGSGFTQATRHLAAMVSRPRVPYYEGAAKLFKRVEGRPQTPDQMAEVPESVQRALREVVPLLEREESRLLAAMIADLVTPCAHAADRPVLRPTFEELKIGTCPLAEKYFLEIADGFVRRKGRANVLVSTEERPLLIEKMGLGDDHSCINLREVSLNGVRLPAGCLLGVQRDLDIEVRPNRTLPGSVIAVDACAGFRLLRFTTLAVSPEHRRRAFSVHFQAQLDACLFAPGETTVEQLHQVAKAQV